MSFIEWMDELMPEMEFVAPERIESICLSYENAAEAGGSLTENICIDRREERIVVQKCEVVRAEEPCCYKSSHVYEIGDKVVEALAAFQECDFTEDIAGERDF